MIIGYDINFDFNHSDLNVKLKILKNDFNSSNNQAIIKPLDLEYESSALYFGIPILNNLDDSNNSLIIGHYFFNDNINKRIGSYIFSYCSKINHYVNLCDFTFHIFVISNYYNCDNYGIPTFQNTRPQSRLHQDEGEKEEKDLVFTAIVILMIYVQHNTFNLRKSVALDG
uniref:DUF7431 domain-containing protein n=1 Tax=Rhizophagus irregularis (strain DAOM 181602 / DAOM 197198 / MUCL 43194) TaxID=747089 RepID=U9TAL2_RHIID